MRKNSIIQFILIVLVLLCIGIANFAKPQNLDKPLPGRLRAGYMASSNISLLPRMSQVGMNAAIPKFDVLNTPFPIDTVVKLRNWAGQCNQHNLLFMPVFNWWTASHARYLPNYNHVVTDLGTVLANTPCPYTQDFWDRWILPRLIALIHAVDDLPLGAVLIDMEMYDAEHSNYYYGCYCDKCFSRYLKAKGQSGPLPALASRAKVVKYIGDMSFYESLQREAVRTFAGILRESAQKLNPGVRLGVLQMDSTIPVQQGMALGLGTPLLPVICLTEKTYSNGYTRYIDSTQKSFKDIGAHVDLLVGIWQSRYPPENIPEQLYYCAHDSYGYWVYTMETFANPDYSPLPGTLDEGWSAIKLADQELDKLGLNQNYKTAFQIRPFEPPPTPLPWSEFVKYDFTQTRAHAFEQMPIARLRGINWLYFYANKGENLKFEVTWRRVGNLTDPVRIGLVAPNGTHLGIGTATLMHSFTLHSVAPMNGVYGLVVLSEHGANAADITGASHSYKVQMAPPRGAWFVDKLPPVFVSVLPGALSVEIQFVTESSAEAVKGTVIAEDGSQLWSGVVDGPTKVQLNNPKTGLLQISFEKLSGRVFEDVKIIGLKGVLPFLATDPTVLFSK